MRNEACLQAVIAISLTIVFDSWNIQVGTGAAFALIVISISIVIEPYVNVSMSTEHRMYKPRKQRIIEKLKMVSRTHFDMQGGDPRACAGRRRTDAGGSRRVCADPTINWSERVDLRKLVWYRRVPETLSAGVLSKLSLFVVLMSLCLTLLTDNLADPANGRTGERAQAGILVLNLLMLALFVFAFVCDLVAEATLYSSALSGLCRCRRCRCRC